MKETERTGETGNNRMIPKGGKRDEQIAIDSNKCRVGLKVICFQVLQGLRKPMCLVQYFRGTEL